MNADYTRIFATPDELVEFLMLTVEEQNRLLLDLMAKGKIDMLGASCIIKNDRLQ